MKTERVKEIRSRLEKATDGPWKMQPNGLFSEERDKHILVPDADGYFDVGDIWDDVNFIINSPQDISDLLDTVEDQGKELDEANKVIKFRGKEHLCMDQPRCNHWHDGKCHFDYTCPYKHITEENSK